MQVNVAGIRRNIKNLAHNYSDAQVKVREATSNDPWGPSATLMAEIADLTYNVVAYSEIMAMIWKRLNDHGKNWRHVYKALILLEYLIKTGTEKVAQQCKENVFAIQTLREFQYLEEGKDQGLHVREKAKLLVTLLKDDERLKNERAKALKAKERFAQHASGFGSDGSIDGPTHRESSGWHDTDSRPMNVNDMEFVRPQTVGEEELQLQLAMAMSREEAEQEEAKRRSDDVRLQLALSQSEQDFKTQKDPQVGATQSKQQQNHLLDLLDISLGATSISSPPGAVDPWAMPQPPNSRPSAALPGDPWSRTSSPPVDPWCPVSKGAAASLPPKPDGWLSRNESPSIASGSSNEGWLNTPQQLASNGNVSGDPWSAKKSSPNDPWKTEQEKGTSSDPWQTYKDSSNSNSDQAASVDPWSPGHNKVPPMGARPSPVGAIMSPSSDLDEFDVITNRTKTNGTNNNNSSILEEMDPLSSSHSKPPQKTPQSFLGENSSLVNLDNLIKLPVPNTAMSHNNPYNPFSDVTGTQPKNAFQQNQSVPSINQLKQTPFPISISQDPWTPVNNSTNNSQQIKSFGNPFYDGEFLQPIIQPDITPVNNNCNNFYEKFHDDKENGDSDQDNFYFSRCKKFNNIENYFSQTVGAWTLK
ncbi:epsin-2 isoform X2 [Lutzomyia longipalpis]|nr:epsin-2 isoform X2 [Lutzomyia longipalpis]XP_055689287.1 epsin-2 isoform X2 [Lutzomyia longipalpis]XP_055689288.1 epsin-2 isoform X2 [Lutzomyia longipalpis]